MTVSKKTVHFTSRGILIAGDLYLPGSGAPDRRGAAIVVGHPGTGVKEQASGLYARRLAENGFVGLAFDAAYQGESGGEPRELEDPYQRVEDFKSAVTFLSLLDEVDPARIALVGICASGGYGIFAAQTDVRIKAVAGVVPMCTGAMARAALRDTTGVVSSAALVGPLQWAAQERLTEARGGQGAMISTLDFEEAREYYTSPLGYSPKCSNNQLARSFELMVNYDSFAYIDWISPRPLLMIVSTVPQLGFDTIPYAKAAYENAADPKELVEIGGKKHLDLYHDTAETIPTLVCFMANALCS